MTGISVVSQPLAETERNARIYAGGILVWPGLPAVAALAARLGDHLRNHFGSDPERAHARFNEKALAEALHASQQDLEADSDCRARIRQMFEATGMAVGNNCADRLKVRAQVPCTSAGQPSVAPLTAHRDTWGTNIMAQTNWWAPIYPAPSGRTIALFPAWFERAVDNNSADWDFAEMRRLQRSDGQTDYPLLPTATNPPAWHDALPVSIEPGGLLAFSGAHLHASVPNNSDCIRFSFEIRTVNTADALAGRGAANVDGRAQRVLRQLFRGLADDRKLGKMV